MTKFQEYQKQWQQDPEAFRTAAVAGIQPYLTAKKQMHKGNDLFPQTTLRIAVLAQRFTKDLVGTPDWQGKDALDYVASVLGMAAKQLPRFLIEGAITFLRLNDEVGLSDETWLACETAALKAAGRVARKAGYHETVLAAIAELLTKRPGKYAKTIAELAERLDADGQLLTAEEAAERNLAADELRAIEQAELLAKNRKPGILVELAANHAALLSKQELVFLRKNAERLLAAIALAEQDSGSEGTQCDCTEPAEELEVALA